MSKQDLPISKLPQADLPLTRNEEIAIVQNGITKRATINDMGSTGKYTPLFTSLVNAASFANRVDAIWTKTNKTITVNAAINADVTTGSVLTTAKISLPFENADVNIIGSGTLFYNVQGGFPVYVDYSDGQHAIIKFIPPASGLGSLNISFTYQLA